jgi:hypothetical protein
MKLVTLATFPSEFEATLAKNALEQNGINACFAGGEQVIVQTYALPAYGTTLAVAENDLKEAIENPQGSKREWRFPIRMSTRRDDR